MSRTVAAIAASALIVGTANGARVMVPWQVTAPSVPCVRIGDPPGVGKRPGVEWSMPVFVPTRGISVRLQLWTLT